MQTKNEHEYCVNARVHFNTRNRVRFLNTRRKLCEKCEKVEKKCKILDDENFVAFELFGKKTRNRVIFAQLLQCICDFYVQITQKHAHNAFLYHANFVTPPKFFNI